MAHTRRLPMPVTPVWDWQMRAACRGLDSAVFFHPAHERGQSAAARDDGAKQVCFTCPVREACLRHALATQEPYGIWGGLTAGERAALLRPAPRLGGPDTTTPDTATEEPGAVATDARGSRDGGPHHG